MIAIRHLLNEGFEIVTEKTRVFVDAFFRGAPLPSEIRPDPGKTVLILATHAHWDHFDADLVEKAVHKTDGIFVGPREAIRPLISRLPPEKLIEMEPSETSAGKLFSSEKRKVGAVSITAFRSFHGRGHNSYLAELDGFRFFHDGDNEDTRRIDKKILGRLDALFIGPWRGSGWVEFIQELNPGRWFLMHLSEEEFERHAEGKLLPEDCDCPNTPAGLAVLKPGELFKF